MMEMQPLIDYYEDDEVKITFLDMGSDDLVLSFSSSPRYAQGETMSQEQFVGTLVNYKMSALFIIEKVRTQLGNNLNLAKIAAQIALKAKDYNKVFSIGYCSGGSLGIVFSKYINMDSVVAITPQWSFHPDVMPKEDFRYALFTEYYENWDMKDIGGHFKDATDYYIFGTSSSVDMLQLSHFPEQDNIHMIQFGPAFGHDLPVALPSGKLEDLIMSCLYGDGQEVLDFIASYYEEPDQNTL